MKEKKFYQKWWFWVIVIILLLIISAYNTKEREEWEKENCDLTFYKYTYNDGCSSACENKCSDNGFHSSSGHFSPSLSYEEMNDRTLKKRCECYCRGCRE